MPTFPATILKAGPNSMGPSARAMVDELGRTRRIEKLIEHIATRTATCTAAKSQSKSV